MGNAGGGGRDSRFRGNDGKGWAGSIERGGNHDKGKVTASDEIATPRSCGVRNDVYGPLLPLDNAWRRPPLLAVYTGAKLNERVKFFNRQYVDQEQHPDAPQGQWQVAWGERPRRRSRGPRYPRSTNGNKRLRSSGAEAALAGWICAVACVPPPGWGGRGFG